MKKQNITKTVMVLLPLIVSQNANAQATKADRPLPELAYPYNALEPYIDAQTMDLHYNKHYKGYYNNFLNAANGTDLEYKQLTDIFASVSAQPAVVRNNAGGYFNHMLFWENLTPDKTIPSADLQKAIDENFGSINNMAELFNKAAATQFGSGWAWLVLTHDGKLAVTSTPNQDNPLMDVAAVKGTPLLALDVWEHAYYLKYQNRRPDYIAAFWNIVNWDTVSERYKKAVKN